MEEIIKAFGDMKAGTGRSPLRDPLHFLRPVNREESTRILLSGGTPIFEHSTDYDTSGRYQYLMSMLARLDDTPLGQLYQEAINDALLALDFIDSIGTSDALGLSCRLYLRCSPDEARDKFFTQENRKNSIEYLMSNPSTEEKKAGFDLVRDHLAGAFALFDAEFSIKADSIGDPIFIDQQSRIVYVDPDISEPKNIIQCIIGHEVWGHYIRRANGSTQPQELRNLLMYGFPGYDLTEEGFAVCMGGLLEDVPVNRMRTLHGRFLAAGMALEGFPAPEVMVSLSGLGFSNQEAAVITRRAYRAGSLADGHNGATVQDAVYIIGYEAIQDYAKTLMQSDNPFRDALREGKLDSLLVGKVTLDLARNMKELRIAGINLNRPEYNPAKS